MNKGYAICFNEWALDKDIKSELGLLLIISSLTAEKGYCWATNSHFAKLFSIDETTVSRRLQKLTTKGYIAIEYKKRGAEVVDRKIRLAKTPTDGLQKRQPTISKNAKDNNTIINNTSNNKGVTSSNPVEDKKETTTKEINNTKNEILPVEIIDYYKNNISSLNGKIKEIKTFKVLSENNHDLNEILTGLKNYSQKLPNNKEYVTSLYNFISECKYKDYQENNLHPIFGEWK